MADTQKSSRPAGKQAAQTQDGQDRAHESESTVRKGYEDAQDPEPQGDGDPGPDQVQQQSSNRGQG